MKLERKSKSAFSDLDMVTYCWRVEEVKTEDEILDLLFKISKLGKCSGFGFYGYSDMDTHENEASFKTIDEVKKNRAEISRIDPDSATTYINSGDGWVDVIINPFWDNEDGTWMRVRGPESAVRKVSAEVKKMFE